MNTGYDKRQRLAEIADFERRIAAWEWMLPLDRVTMLHEQGYTFFQSGNYDNKGCNPKHYLGSDNQPAGDESATYPRAANRKLLSPFLRSIEVPPSLSASQFLTIQGESDGETD